MSEAHPSYPVTKAVPPVVSIGMPVYNGEKYVREALDSLLAQSFTDFELIISDNSSTDKTEEICREYAKRDQRIVYVRQDKNLGPVLNFKFVLDHARAKYFMWAACDDTWERDCVQRYVDVLDQDDAVSVVLGKFWVVSIFMPLLAMRNVPSLFFINNPDPLIRVKKYLELPENSHKANLIYGLWRLEVIKEFFTRSCEFSDGVYQGLDLAMLARILVSFRGRQIDKVLFYKRYPYIPQGHLFSYMDKKLVLRALMRFRIYKTKNQSGSVVRDYCSLLKAMMKDVLDSNVGTDFNKVIDEHCVKRQSSSRSENLISNLRTAYKHGLFRH